MSVLPWSGVVGVIEISVLAMHIEVLGYTNRIYSLLLVALSQDIREN